MILASQSPRRCDLLRLITTDFLVIPANVDESHRIDESPSEYVCRLAEGKARAIADQGAPKQTIIGSDTAVTYSGHILNKPRDKEDYLTMMELLSGTTHQVYSGICVLNGAQSIIRSVRTDVTFRELSISERLNYWDTGEPSDKAGGYGIQGGAARFVQSINGSYTNVVGLPLVELEAMLNGAS
ncbi:MAG TPA: septum formation protein Maf [Gammaproteobacteria bacterium]|nr:septum formation protein Maf [Gammaproteobacteria bacterium]|tara:strand:+ start:1244 stop:1795 length:552 start_codon:yes stop_codon:yes gene_type:complete